MAGVTEKIQLTSGNTHVQYGSAAGSNPGTPSANAGGDRDKRARKVVGGKVGHTADPVKNSPIDTTGPGKT